MSFPYGQPITIYAFYNKKYFFDGINSIKVLTMQAGRARIKILFSYSNLWHFDWREVHA